MDRPDNSRLAAANRSARRQFAIGIALISVIPILSFWALRASIADTSGSPMVRAWEIFLYLLIPAASVTGYLLLRKYPDNVTLQRSYLESIIHGQFPDKSGLLKTEDDIEAVSKCMNLIVDTLENKAQAVDTERVQIQRVRAEKIETMSTMSMGLAHDFNNFLAAILGNASILLRSMPAESPNKVNAQQIESTSLRAVELANQIMAYSGKGRFVVEDCDLTGIINEMMNMLNVSVAKGIRIEYQLDAELPMVKGDPAQMRQLIMSMILNASDAIVSMVDRTGVIRVETGSRYCERSLLADTWLDENQPAGRYVFLAVGDNGCGMAPAIQNKMFDPFFTTKIRGHGMGMAVGLGIIRSHSGAIQVQSEPEKGTTLTIYFPAG